ncbi:hypothetical protein K439DRAFT_1627079 [Ramaria rubella]|nr:hypothetical protein K439DRAFT_1627079 [Ramaria rubella]
MPPNTTRPKSLTSAKTKTEVNESQSILNDLADPSKCDDELARRLASALNLRDHVGPAKPSIKGKEKATRRPETSEERRTLAMKAANAASQSLSVVIQLGWKVSNATTNKGCSVDSVLSIASSFKVAISSLREAIPRALDVERVVSSFINKLIAVHLYEIALELLDELRRNLIQLLDGSPREREPGGPPGPKHNMPIFTQYFHLLRYPLPAPKDSILLGLIGTSLSHAVTILVSLVSQPPATGTVLLTFVSALEEDGGIITWNRYLPQEIADTILSRAHRILVTTFTTSNTPSAVLLRFRIWALRCILCKTALEPDTFWSQATNYLATYGKTAIKAEDCAGAIRDAMMLFDALTTMAQQRSDALTIMSGSSFVKFCEIALVFARRDDDFSHVKSIVQFIKSDQTEASHSSLTTDPPDTHLYVMFCQGVTMLEKFSTSASETDIVNALGQCIDVLPVPKVLDPDSKSIAWRPLEKLRRLCGKLLVEGNGGRELMNTAILLVDGVIKSIESIRLKPTSKMLIDRLACAIDSLCVLSKTSLSLVQPHTPTAACQYLQRGIDLLNIYSKSFNPADMDERQSFAKVWRCLSGTFWAHATTFYQHSDYAGAIRFLVPACESGATTCEMVKGLIIDNDVSTGPENGTWMALRNHLPRRWEVLGDCYLKIGDRKSAYEALLKSIEAYSFGLLGLSASSMSPSQISSDPAYSRLASLVERITHLAVFELFITDRASLCHSLSHASTMEAEVLGILLEWQVASLEDRLSKPETQSVLIHLLRDALHVYSVQYPIRRARVLLWQLEIAYRTDDLSYSAIDAAVEIRNLLSQPQDSGRDVGHSNFRPQYQAAVHMWMALHTHRRSENRSKSATIILQEATHASQILRGLFPVNTCPVSLKSPKRSPKSSPKTLRMSTRTSPRKKTNVTKTNPATPKPRKKTAETPPRVARGRPSPKTTQPDKNALVTDPRLSKVVDIFAQLLGLSGHVIPRIQFLSILQRLAEHSSAPSTNEFVRASVDAGAEYLRLGKTQRALTIYAHALAAVNDAAHATVSTDVRVFLLLRYAEALALNGNVSKSVQLYAEARDSSQIPEGHQHGSTISRIRARIQVLERSALAFKVFSLIQVANGDSHAALSSLKQSLRLRNKAFDSLVRLSPRHHHVERNPFDMTPLTAALPDSEPPRLNEEDTQEKVYRIDTVADTLQWRVAEGLLILLFDLAHAYFQQGSVRAAEYFIEQARSLACSLNSSIMIARALTRRCELKLHQGNIEAATAALLEAAELLHDLPGVDAANVTRLRARLNECLNHDGEARNLYLQATTMVSELALTLSNIDSAVPGPRRSFTSPPGRLNKVDAIAPDFLAMILRQQIWLQRNEPRNRTQELLEWLSALPRSWHTKAEELAISAKLALHDAHIQFRTDLFLSSLTESTISIPMGLSSHEVKGLSAGTKQMLDTLSTADSLLWTTLEYVSTRGQALHARDAAMSLTLARFFQTSLGKGCGSDATIAIGLLDASAAITLHHEFIDAIEQKFPESAPDELMWPNPSDALTGILQSREIVESRDTDGQPAVDLKAYWESVRTRCQLDHGQHRCLPTSQLNLLPTNWTVVNISITDDKSTMFLSRQRSDSEPMLFCIPLERHSRKDEDPGEQFVFNGAMQQLKNILRDSDQSAQDAKKVSTDDREAKSAWWAQRVSLDKRMQDLLDNIEFCWLGAFKTILHQPVRTPADIMENFRDRFDKIFHRTLASDRKRASRMKLDGCLIECFASLSPKCRDEEIEDLIYFVLDLYQFHGFHVPLSEIDVDQVAVELRTALEEHATKGKGFVTPVEDAHLFLVLDKNVQGIPWESIPILRGKSVSRIPSFSFLLDRIEFAKVQRKAVGSPVLAEPQQNCAIVDPRRTYYVLNPSGDLTKSEDRFKPWTKDMQRAAGWQGIVGRAPVEQELLHALRNNDLVIYMGHGGAEQYVRSTKIRHLPRCAATMLWGCSSGLMRDMGDFDRTGTPYNYMVAGCPSLVACLWDVTDNELDKISRSVFEKLRLDVENVRSWSSESHDTAMSVVAAVNQSRDACKLKYLTGAAPVVYGIPFYL